MNARLNALRSTLLALVGATCIAIAPTASATATGDLFKAVSIDDLRATRRLLQDHEVDPHAVDARGDTILIAALRNDAQRIVAYLIADPATDVNATDPAGETPLMIAAYRKQAGYIDPLLDRGAAVNGSGWSALHYAAAVGAGDIVAVLLKHGAAIDARSPNGTTPLMMAARGRFDEVSRQLVQAGADPTAVNESHLTASDFAKRASDPELADWLGERATAWRSGRGSAEKPRQ